MCENYKEEEISPNYEEKDITIQKLTNDEEILEETKSNIIINKIETESNNLNTLKEVENKLNDNFKANENQILESIKEIKLDGLDLTTNSQFSNELNSTKENLNEILVLTKSNENIYVEEHKDNKNNDLILEMFEKGNIHLNISDEVKILDDSVKNSIILGNSNTERYLQINGELSPVICDSTEQNFNEKIENCIVPNDNIDNDTETKNIDLQNSLNTLLSGDFDVVSENNDNVALIMELESKEDIKDNIYGHVINQDSMSNSSDSETIINSECIQNEINGDSVENSEQMASVQPISVITIQTCDTVDSDCSEAYLTPNELNDTPKKKLENSNLNLNDHINIVNNLESNFNPSLEPNNEVKNQCENVPEAIIDHKINMDNIDKLEKSLATTINDNAIESDATVVDTLKENIANIDKNKIIENYKEIECENKIDLNIVLEHHNEHSINNAEGINLFFFFTIIFKLVLFLISSS